jgi:8-oxo-dGTP pyrophosphatase MutT (NUDIX family)
MIALLKRKLAGYSPCSLDADKKIRASVLIPVFENSAGVHILLTKRTNKVKYHKGEISFPGGMYEDGDRTAIDTALRECSEEIGVKPSDVEIVGQLDDMRTVTGFVITPYVGIIPCPYSFTLNPDEVHYLINLPFPYLLEYRAEAETVQHEGRLVEIPAIYYEGERIWGATCKLLLQLRKIVEDEKI